MSRVQNIELIHRFFSTLANQDLEGFFELFSPDIELQIIGNTPVSGRWQGHKQFREVLGEVFAAMKPGTYSWGNDYRIVCADDDGAVTMMNGGGITNFEREYRQTYVHVSKIHGGKIVRMYEFFDTSPAQYALFGNDLKVPEKKVNHPLYFMNEPSI